MKRFWIVGLCILLAVATIVVLARFQDSEYPAAVITTLEVDFYPPLFVLGRCYKVEEKGPAKICFFVITEVFAGPDYIQGKSFSCSFEPRLLGWDMLSDPIRRGELVLCLLQRNPRDGSLMPMDSDRTTVLNPEPLTRKGTNGFALTEEWAAAVRTVFLMTDQKRPQTLEQYCESTNPMISAWAVRFLGKRYLQQHEASFAKRFLSARNVTSVVAIDEILSRKEHWRRTSKRYEVFERLVQQSLTHEEEGHLIARLNQMGYEPGVSYEELFRVLQAGILAPGKTSESRWQYYSVFKTALLPERKAEWKLTASAVLKKILNASHDQNIRTDAEGILLSIGRPALSTQKATTKS
jgi:hypothetical protein